MFFKPASVVVMIAALSAGLCTAAEPTKSPGAAPSELFPTDSRRWSQSRAAVVLSDFSKAEPATALTKGRREKGKWKIIPFATADAQGWALSTYSFTDAPVVSMPLAARGWHAVYVGAATVSTGFKEAKNGLKAKLSDEPVFKRMANNLALLPNRVDVIQEEFLTVARLDGQSLELAPLPNLPATVCYVKLVPLGAAEVSAWSAQRALASRATRTAIATFDGHSWIWPYEPKTANDLLANFRGFEDSDIGKWWFQVTFSKEADNQKFGFDLPRWIQKGLVDDLGVAWFAHHTSFAPPDMAYYRRLTAGTKVGVYPFVISWKPGEPKDLCKTVTGYYRAGASGIAIWDPSVEAGWRDRPYGNIFDTLGRLGHRDLVAHWAGKGVPLPLAIPLTRLDENYYSRWFPTTGF